MYTLQVDISIPDDLRDKFDHEVSGRGGDQNVFVSEAVLQALCKSAQPREKTLDDVLAPFREGFASSELSHDELSDLLDDELEDVRRQRAVSRPRA